MSPKPIPKPAPRTSHVRLTLQAEGAVIALLCIAIYGTTGGSWWLFAVLLLAPDLSMLGYLGGNRMGAFCYNVAHSYVTPGVLAACGAAVSMPQVIAIALIWGAHIGLDRAIGYGLKYVSGFKDTHLTKV